MCVLLVSGCGLSIPADPDGTLEGVSGGTLRVGVTANDRWVETASDGDPQGIEPDLVRAFATTIDADIQWVEGSEHDLAESVEQGDLDLAIGGFLDDTPWSSHAGVTRPYVESANEQGKTVRHVMLVPMGENAFLLELDRFLLEQEVSP